ncbi:nucleotide sugar dehydrogenase [Listeria grandensis]|uniref:nucleotide sugar dehydrogenase n=1 Tax=Listeria grandensis TaxID=1494963 RepID=UPI001624EEF1|nr:nucleotide sugar dehydrogenase [Listeria grandensis]MBC1475741.1 nucleotide sugar dehydrogenase [Listeria grandensis]
MKILTVGLGYIGLPTAITFALHGQEVVGVDKNRYVVETLNEGKVHIEEPFLQEALEEVLIRKNFKAQVNIEPADVFIVAVPTPNCDDEYKGCDLTYVVDAIKSVVPHLEAGNTVIIESTISPRTTEDVIKPMIEKAGFEIGKDVFLVHCPERVLPGQVLHELIFNNRIIGGVTPACTERGKEIYGLFVQGELIAAKASAAELSKLMENTYRDVNIALANELVQIGAKLDIDALEVIKMANQHPRVNIHQPGPGVGGHCLAVDPYFIVAKAPEVAQLIKRARKVNSQMPNFIVEQVFDILEKNDGKIITVLGLAYKGNIDDMRESPAIPIVNQLRGMSGYKVRTYDPHVTEADTDTLAEALEGSDMALILCDHNEFKTLPEEAVATMNNRILFDTKNCVVSDAPFKEHYTLGNISTLKNFEGVL